MKKTNSTTASTPAKAAHGGRVARTAATLATLVVLVGIAGCNRNPAGVGVWDMSMNTPIGPIEATLTLNADGTGSMSSLELGEAPFDGATYDGNNVTFDIAVDAQGQVVALGFSGQVDGNAMNGQFSSDFGPIDATGTRQ